MSLPIKVAAVGAAVQRFLPQVGTPILMMLAGMVGMFRGDDPCVGVFQSD